MSRRTVTFITLFILLGLVSLGVFLFSSLGVGEKAPGTNPISALNQFFPFGNNDSTQTPTPSDTSDINEQVNIEVTTGTSLALTQLTTEPVAGFIPISATKLVFTEEITTPATIEDSPFTTPNSVEPEELVPTEQATETITVTGVRYIVQNSGNVFDLYLDTKSPTRITNTTIPRIYDAFFGNGGENVILRYLEDDRKTITTFSASMPSPLTQLPAESSTEIIPPVEPTQLSGMFFPINILSLAPSAKGDRIFYLEDREDGSYGTSSDFLNTLKGTTFTSGLKEWAIEWLTDKAILFTTKPSGSVPGYTYTFDTVTKTFLKTLGGIPGLTTHASPSGTKILYSESVANTVHLKIYDLATKTVVDLGLNTFPEKCVWEGDNVLYCAIPSSLPPYTYPDAWYQGKVSFSDNIWKLNLLDNTYTTLSVPSDTGASLDIVQPMISSDKTELFFRDKKNSTLWVLELDSN